MHTLIRALVVSGALLATASAASATPAVTPADVGAALAAQLGCAGVFVIGREPAEVLRNDIRAMGPLTATADFSVDRQARTVTGSAPGAADRTALFRPEVGCTLLVDSVDHAALDKQTAGLPPMRSAKHAWPASPAPTPALDVAVRAAFDEQNKDGYPDTRAIIVVQGGRIVAERYAPGFDRDSRFLGWSMGKSVTSALIGTHVDKGRLRLDAPAPVSTWRAAGDPRGAITLRQLLTMTSGLKFDERYVPGDDALPMLFFSRDMAAYAADLPLAHAPGTTWAYSSGTSNILSKLVLDQSDGSLKALTTYARKTLFEPAGMTSAVLEADPSGTPVGSSYLYATARDWARFGLLYLNGGVLDGRRILSSSWIAFSRSPNGVEPQGTYGGQFWLNAGAGDGANRPFKDCPRDLYAARGHNGQIVAIIPSRDTVIVRLGWTPDGRDFDANKHVSRILAALGR